MIDKKNVCKCKENVLKSKENISNHKEYVCKCEEATNKLISILNKQNDMICEFSEFMEERLKSYMNAGGALTIFGIYRSQTLIKECEEIRDAFNNIFEEALKNQHQEETIEKEKTAIKGSRLSDN